jgi:hypothetical protein
MINRSIIKKKIIAEGFSVFISDDETDFAFSVKLQIQKLMITLTTKGLRKPAISFEC